MSTARRVDRVKYFWATTRVAPGKSTPATATRRKWSDWGECSASCVRTRHRLNCDDLIQSNSDNPSSHLKRPAVVLSESEQLKATNKVVPIKRKPEQSSDTSNSFNLLQLIGPKQEQQQQEVTSKSSKRRREAGDNLAPLGPDSSASSTGQLLASSSEQPDDDQDYADEGDEEDGDDSCAQVDTSKTFEEQSCTGGQCKLTSAANQQRTRPKAVSAHSQHTSSNGYATDNGAHHHHHHQVAASGEQTRPHSVRQQAGHNSAPVPEVSQPNKSFINFNQVGTQIELASEHSFMSNGMGLRSTNATGVALWPTNSTAPGQSQPTRAISEPGKGLAGLGQQNELLIQVAILIGLLVSLILFTLLLVRKLFLNSSGANVKSSSSYHWMLAKQTRRDAACCHAGGKRRLCPGRLEKARPSAGSEQRICSLGSGSSGDTLVHDHSHRLAPPHHMCYLWNGRRDQSVSRHTQAHDSPSSSSLGHGHKTHLITATGQQQQQLFVDLNGRHFLSPKSTASLTRPAGATQYPAALYIEPASYYYLESQGRPVEPRDNCDNGRQGIDEHEYDRTQQLGGFDDILLSGFGQQTGHVGPVDSSWRVHTSHALDGSNLKKLNTPNVPGERGHTSANQYESPEANPSASRSPSLSSTGGESSSLSVQSTTAQLVSNSQSNGNGAGGSSSLEQAAEIDECGAPAACPNPTQSAAVIVSNPLQSSLSSSVASTIEIDHSPANSNGPARLGGHRRQASVALDSLVGRTKCGPQSQPNSPNPNNRTRNSSSSAIKRQQYRQAGRSNQSDSRPSLTSNLAAQSVSPRMIGVDRGREDDDGRHFYEEINNDDP